VVLQQVDLKMEKKKEDVLCWVSSLLMWQRKMFTRALTPVVKSPLGKNRGEKEAMQAKKGEISRRWPAEKRNDAAFPLEQPLLGSLVGSNDHHR